MRLSGVSALSIAAGPSARATSIARGVSLAGRPVRLTDIEYRMLLELSVDAGPGAGPRRAPAAGLGPGTLRPHRRGALRLKNLRSKLGDAADNPAYILNEHCVG